MKFDRQRGQMIDDIEAGVALTRNLIGKDRLDNRVMTAMRQVPREKFVPPDLRHAAFRDGALPVGHGQTISQPYIVALMTDMFSPAAGKDEKFEMPEPSEYQQPAFAAYPLPGVFVVCQFWFV